MPASTRPCNCASKRRALPAEEPLVYVGDGYSDRCAALVADRVFARHDLADYLASQGVLMKQNFKLEGRATSYLRINGVWRDHLLFARVSPDSESRPALRVI